MQRYQVGRKNIGLYKVGDKNMRKSRKKYLVLIAIAFLLTPSAVDAAFEARQAMHFGGEWLLVPLVILIGLVVDSFKALIKEVQK